MKEIEIINFKIILFNLSPIDPHEFEKRLWVEFDNVFDKTEFTIPTDPNIPVDMPILRLASDDNIFKMELSKDRFTFYLDSKEGEKLKFESLKKYFKFIKSALEKIELKFYRFGLIITAIKKDESPVESIKNKYFKINRDYSEMLIKYNVPFSYKEKNYNEVVNITGAQATVGKSEPFSVVFIQRDINNVVINEKEAVDVFVLLEQIIDRTSSNKMDNII